LSELDRHVVDDGARTDGVSSDWHRLAEPALAVRSDGTVVVAYQDGTTGELLMAVEEGDGFTRSTLGGGSTAAYDGWYGFSTDVVGRGSSAPVVSTFRRDLDPDPADEGLEFYNVP
jgi:hypothetical protein